MGASELVVKELDPDIRAKLDECKRIRARIAAGLHSEADYSETLVECNALESQYVKES